MVCLAVDDGVGRDRWERGIGVYRWGGDWKVREKSFGFGLDFSLGLDDGLRWWRRRRGCGIGHRGLGLDLGLRLLLGYCYCAGGAVWAGDCCYDDWEGAGEGDSEGRSWLSRCNRER